MIRHNRHPSRQIHDPVKLELVSRGENEPRPQTREGRHSQVIRGQQQAHFGPHRRAIAWRRPQNPKTP